MIKPEMFGSALVPCGICSSEKGCKRRRRSSSWPAPLDSSSIKSLESLADPSGFEDYPEREEKDEKRVEHVDVVYLHKTEIVVCRVA